MILTLLPIVSNIFAFALKKKGYSYLTPELMVKFFSDPIVFLLMLFVLWMIGIFLLYAMSVAIVFFQHIWKKERVSIVHIVVSATKRFALYIRKRHFQVIFLTWRMFLFMSIPLIGGIFFRTRMPKYILNIVFQTPGIEFAFVVLTMLIMLSGFRNFFTLPYALLEKKEDKEARKSSSLLVKKKIIRTIFYFLIWNSIIFLLAALFYIAIIVIAAIIVLLFVPSVLKIAVFWTICDHINIYAGIFLGVMGVMANLALSMDLYYRYKQEAGEEDNEIIETEADEKRRRLYTRLLAGIAIIVVIIDIIFTYDTIRNGGNSTFDKFQSIKITAHRGSSNEAPENTMPAIEKSMENLADYAEIDVQETKDGVVVLMHDSNTVRTTGVNGRISHMTYAEVLGLDAGGWFGTEYANTKIPTLREVLEFCKGRIKLNIEIKSNKKTPALEEHVVQLIEEYEFQRQCVITSVSKQALTKVKACNEEIKTGYILTTVYGNYFSDVEIDFLSMKSAFVTEKVVRLAHNNGKEVHVWTVNSKSEAKRLNKLGVDNIITDKPIYVREALYQGNEQNTLFELVNMVFK